VGGTSAPSVARLYARRSWTAQLNHTAQLSTNLLNEARFSWLNGGASADITYIYNAVGSGSVAFSAGVTGVDVNSGLSVFSPYSSASTLEQEPVNLSVVGITANPTNQSVAQGQTAWFSVTVIGTVGETPVDHDQGPFPQRPPRVTLPEGPLPMVSHRHRFRGAAWSGGSDMGIVLVVGMMLYSVGLCIFFQRFSDPGPEIRPGQRGWTHPADRVVIPDRVPAEWVDAYRAEQEG